MFGLVNLSLDNKMLRSTPNLCSTLFSLHPWLFISQWKNAKKVDTKIFTLTKWKNTFRKPFQILILREKKGHFTSLSPKRHVYTGRKLTSHIINPRHIYLIINLYLCTHYSGGMSWLISFRWSSSSCEQREAKKSEWKYVPSRGIEPAAPCFQACRSKHSAKGTVDNLLKRLV